MPKGQMNLRTMELNSDALKEKKGEGESNKVLKNISRVND